MALVFVGHFFMQKPRSEIPMKHLLWFFAANFYFWVRHPVLVAYFVRRTQRFPNIAFPQTVNEKFLWRKVVDRNPMFVCLSDKIACKKWVAAQAPELNIAAVRWSGTSVQSLPGELLCGPGVLKANHGCGTNILVGEEGVSREEIGRVAGSWLSYDHGDQHGEWAYSCVKRKFFWEELIRPRFGALTEVKVFTFGDKVKRIVHIADRFHEIRANAWEHDHGGRLVSSREQATLAGQDNELVLPSQIDEAVEIAKTLGAPFDHVRVDLLFDGAEWWLGELTVYNQAGYMYIPSASDPHSELSKAWDIRKSYFFNGQECGFIKRCYALALRRFLERRSDSF